MKFDLVVAIFPNLVANDYKLHVVVNGLVTFWLISTSVEYLPHILGMLDTDHSCTCHSFLIGWSPYSSRCSSTCWNWHFLVPNGTTKCPSFVTPSCSLSSPTLWKPNGLVLSLVLGFFGGSPTWAKVCFISSICSLRYHVNMFPFMCRSKGGRLVINLSYHTYILFILSPLLYNSTYMSWFATSYGCPFFTMLVWPYYWPSRYPFASMPLWEWMYNSPRYISRYCHNYCFGKWSTCSKGGLQVFPLPHPTTSGYPHHQRWLLDLDGHCHYWPNSHIYDAMNINDDITCNDDNCLGKDMNIH